MCSAGLALAELVLGAADHHVALVVHVVLDQRQQAERARHVVDERDHVHAERVLEGRVLVEVVQHDLRDSVALQLDHEPDAGLVGLVAEVRDLLEPAVVHLLRDLLDQTAAVVAAVALGHLVGQLGDDDRLLALAQRLDVRAPADHHPATTRLVGVLDPAVADDDAAGGEVGSLHVLHQALDVDVRVLDVGDARVDRLPQVVRRDVGGHPDGDPGRAVDQEVREPGRENQWLLAGLVVVRDEVHRVRVDVAEHLGGEAGEAGLRVPHGRGGVVVDRAEVPLRIDQRVPHGEVLPEAHQGVVDRRVAVRVVVAHHAADDVRALAVGPVRLEPGLVHGEQHAPVNRLQPVAHVGKRPPDDHAHRVIEVRRPHLLLEPAGLDVAAGQLLNGHPLHPFEKSYSQPRDEPRFFAKTKQSADAGRPQCSARGRPRTKECAGLQP